QCLKSSPRQWWGDNRGKVMAGVTVAGLATCAFTAGIGCAIATGVGAGLSAADRVYEFHEAGDYSAGAFAALGLGLAMDGAFRGSGVGRGRVLNIGSVNRPLAGAVNLDVMPGRGVNVIGDARALPFADHTFDRVVAERLPSLLGTDPRVAGEVYRVLGP